MDNQKKERKNEIRKKNSEKIRRIMNKSVVKERKKSEQEVK